MTTVDKTVDLLMAQLARLDRMTVSRGEQMAESIEALKAECERAKAVNDTARNIVSLGELHMKAEMLQMQSPERQFHPGGIFSEKVDASFASPSRALNPAPDFGGRTRVNAMGEFECEDGLDAMTGWVESARSEAADERAAARQREAEEGEA